MLLWYIFDIPYFKLSYYSHSCCICRMQQYSFLLNDIFRILLHWHPHNQRFWPTTLLILIVFNMYNWVEGTGYWVQQKRGRMSQYQIQKVWNILQFRKGWNYNQDLQTPSLPLWILLLSTFLLTLHCGGCGSRKINWPSQASLWLETLLCVEILNQCCKTIHQ